MQYGISVLREAYKSQTLVPVIGTGLSKSFKMPDWGELILQIATMYNLPEKQMESIKKLISQKHYIDAIEQIKAQGIDELRIQTSVSDYIGQKKKTADKDVDHNYTDLVEMHCTKYITTNYDNLLADYSGSQAFTLEDIGQSFLNEISHSKYHGIIINLHGMIGKPHTIVFSKESYDKLYNSDLFKETFEAFKNHYTFLFIGFSLDDIYFQELLETSKRRTRTRHYILLNENEATEDRIRLLRNRFDVDCITYSLAGTSHQQAIRNILDSICSLEQEPQTAETNCIESSAPDVSSREGHLFKVLRQIRKNESKYQIETALKKYQRLLLDEGFSGLSDNEKADVYLGMVFCYGYLRDYPNMKKYLEMASSINTKKGHYYYQRAAEYYLNLSQWEKAIEAVETAVNLKPNAPTLLLFRDFLYACSRIAGAKTVIGPQLLEEYRITLHKYVDNDFQLYTEKLSKADQEYMYTTLGYLAGQVYQQHSDAIKLLNKAYHFGKNLHILEELGLEYYYYATSNAQSENEIQLINVDMPSLRKARDCFELVLAKSTGSFKESVYKRIGYQYLKSLEIFKDYYRLSKEYDAVYPYFSKEYDMLLMKAYCDLEMGKLDNSLLLKLKPEDRLLVRMDYYRREKRFDIICEELRPVIDKAETPSKGVYQLFLDSLFFGKEKELFEDYYAKYRKHWGKDDASTLYEIYSIELAGDLEGAEKSYLALGAGSDSPLIYQQLLQFYTRQNRLDKAEEVYDKLATEWRHISDPDASAFYYAYITFLINQQKYAKAVDVYCANEERITDETIKVWLENLIKPLICDYSNYEQRISEHENKYKEFSDPSELFDIAMLYLNNNQFEKAKEYLDKAEMLGYPIDGQVRNALEILLGKMVDNTTQIPRVCEIFAINQLQMFRKDIAVLEQERSRLSEEVLLDAQSIYLLFFINKLDCLNKFKRIYITYAAQYDIHISLFCRESQLIRRIIAWIGNDPRIRLVAPRIKWYHDIKNKYPNFSRDYISGVCVSNELGIPLVTPYVEVKELLKEAWYGTVGIDALLGTAKVCQGDGSFDNDIGA